MSWYEKLFDKFSLIDRNGQKRTIGGLISELDEKERYFGLYFSAFWCPPCCKFTPKLVEFYESLQEKNGKRFEIIFISSDKDKTDFETYLQKMPWFALEYDHPHSIVYTEKVADLQKRFKVTSIPSLIILDAKDGTLIRNDGRYMIAKDPDGIGFPWYQKSVQEILYQGPLNKNESMCLTNDVLNNKLFGILFSAQWCPPCREFTKKLKETVGHLKAKGVEWEIVFCSADRNIESFRDHVSTLPNDWYVIPFGDERKDALCRFFNVTGIPSFILIDENMEAIRTNGRLCVTIDPTGENFPWRPKIVEDINDITAQSINDTASLIIFTEGIESHVKSARDSLKIVAEEFEENKKKCKMENEYIPDIVFLYEEKPSEVAESIKSYAELEDKVPLIVLLDVPSQQMYVDENSTISVHVLKRLVDDYCASRLIMADIPD